MAAKLNVCKRGGSKPFRRHPIGATGGSLVSKPFNTVRAQNAGAAYRNRICPPVDIEAREKVVHVHDLHSLSSLAKMEVDVGQEVSCQRMHLFWDPTPLGPVCTQCLDDTAVAAMGLMCTRLSCVVEALSTHANLVDASLNESEAMAQLVSEMSGNGNASPHPLPSEAKPTDKTNMKLSAIKGSSLSGSGSRSRRRSLTLESHSGKAC